MPIALHLLCEQVPLDEPLLQRLADVVFSGEPGEGPLRISLCVVDDAESHRINREFLQHDYPTDVIAFDLRGEQEPQLEDDVDAELIVNAEFAAREAAERGHEPTAELLFYVAHGLLHLLGYDDAVPAERDRMHRLQARYLAEVGVVTRS